MKILTFICVFALSIQVSRAYVLTINSSGKKVQWHSKVNSLNFSFNTSNCNSSLNTCSNSQLVSIAQNASSAWSTNSKFTITTTSTSNSAQNGVNDIYFSSDQSLFTGSGVVAVTQVAYKESSGEILEADMLINSLFSFSTSVSSEKYIGNVITHELGHALGMGHGQVHRSSMFYTLAIGQSQLENDDANGVQDLYSSTYHAGVISGTIIGGGSRIGIFGAHVQAISSTTGNIVAGVLSSPDGSFSIKNVPINDVYYLYISPSKAQSDTLPSYYASVRGDFCSGGQYYRGSFFQTCYNSDVGQPQEIYLSSSNYKVSVGSVTIRCALDVPQDYLSNKGVSQNTLDIDSSNLVGYAQTGFFSLSDISLNVADEFYLDLSGYTPSSSQEYLEVRVLSQTLYSMTKLTLEIDPVAAAAQTFPDNLDFQGLSYTSDYAPDLNIVGRVQLDSANVLNNIFTLKVTPQDLSTFIGGTSYSKGDFYPSYSLFGDPLAFYLLTISVMTKNSNGSYSRTAIKKNTKIYDNYSCPDAPRAYSVSAIVSNDSDSTQVRTKKGSGGCGTIDLNNSSGPGSGGPVSFCVGLLLTMGLAFSRKKMWQKSSL